MSFEKDLRALNLPEKELKRILQAKKLYVKRLKLQRVTLDELARAHFKRHYRDNNNKWDSKVNKAEFGRLMDRRHSIHERLRRFAGEKTEPEWDSP